MELRINRRRLLAVALAVVLVAETAGVVAASFTGPVAADPASVQAPAGNVLAAEATPQPEPVIAAAADTAPAVGAPASRSAAAATADASPDPVVAPAPAATPKPTPQAGTAHPANAMPRTKSTRKPKAASSGGSRGASGSSHRSSGSYAGRNHVWIPALGISKSVHVFPCDRSRPPDNFMYRWGCAGRNNVYLLGHAYAPMKPLHDAYVRGGLHVGMKAYYAGADGTVHVYAVTYWKVVRPTTAAAWAWAAQSRPSMTLQTCVGANSAYRLMVRLVEVGG